MHYLGEAGAGENRRTSQRVIHEENIKRLFNLLNSHRELSRTDLARLTGLSPTTVSALVDELLRQNLAVEAGYARTMQTGRKPINLHIHANGRQIPVFSLSRWGIRYTLYNLGMEVLESMFVGHDSGCYGGFQEDAADPYPNAGPDYAELIADILLSRSKCFRADLALVICVNYPGIYLAEQHVFSLSSMHVSFCEDSMKALEERMGLPVFIGNSAQSSAYAEKKYLEAAGQGTDDLIYVLVWDGVGTGIVEKGKIYMGREGFCGEMGHVSVNYRGKRCVCGGRGCLEQYVNVEAIISRVAQLVDFHPLELLPTDPAQLTLEKIGRAYEAGEKEIVSLLDDVAAQLFAGMYSTMCITGIARMYIGGGIERLGARFLDQLRLMAENAGGGLLSRRMCIDYGHISSEDIGRGIAEYYIDKVFEIGKR